MSRRIGPQEYQELRKEYNVAEHNFSQYFERSGGDIYVKSAYDPQERNVGTVPEGPPGTSPTDTFVPSEELTDIGRDISRTRQDLGKFGDIGSYLGMLREVFNASYASNQDIIQQRAAMREALYGERGMKPETMGLLSPGQQEDIRTANRPGLLAGIQALGETEAARGRKVEGVLGEARTEADTRRQLLSDELDRLLTRRSELETRDEERKQELKDEEDELKTSNRAWFMNVLTSYPTIGSLLTEKEMENANKGIIDDEVLTKINQAVTEYMKPEEEEPNITQTEFTDAEGNVYLIGIDTYTGEIVYKTHIGKVPLGGTSSGDGGRRVSGPSTSTPSTTGKGYKQIENYDRSAGEYTGYRFEDNQGSPISAFKYSLATGKDIVDVLRNSGDENDQKFIKEYHAHIQAMRQGIMTEEQVLAELADNYPAIFLGR